MDLQAVVHQIRQSQRTVVVTGSGMSAESGIASFRQALVGEWAQYDVRDLATPQAYARNPKLVWQWYNFRRSLVEAAQPSPAHHALVDIEQSIPEFLLVSLAIDGLHWRAGSRDMIELNGCVQRARCVENGHLGEWEEEGGIPPHCQRCGSQLRPDVVLLGEGFARHDVNRARHAVEQCDTIVFVGDISAIDPVAQFPFMAHRAKATIITITTDDTSIFGVMADHVIRATPGEVLPRLVAQLNEGH
jgi:NAD-dependent deacetylase